jgi:Arc-like DNA binding domain
MAPLTATVSLQVRLPEGLRRKLVQEADKNARSLNGEIVWRLGQSFGTEDAALAEAGEKERARILDEIVHSPEVHKKLVEQLAKSPIFKEWVERKSKRTR